MSYETVDPKSSTTYIPSGYLKVLIGQEESQTGQSAAAIQEQIKMMSYLQTMQSNFQGALGNDQYGKSSQEREKGENWTGRSNLSHSPEVVLAINDILKSGGKNSEDTAKQLREKYGIQAEVKEIKTVNGSGKEVTQKGIMFGNGDFIVDSNGDGNLNAGDYDFAGAIKDLKTKYNVTDKDLDQKVAQMKVQGTGSLTSLETNNTTGLQYGNNDSGANNFALIAAYLQRNGGAGIIDGEYDALGIKKSNSQNDYNSLGVNSFNSQDLNSLITMLFMQAYQQAEASQSQTTQTKTEEVKS